jgi:hypothetical protein
VTFGSGAGRAIIDGAQRRESQAGVTIFGANGAGNKAARRATEAAKDRLTLDVSAGVGTLTLDRTKS